MKRFNTLSFQLAPSVPAHVSSRRRSQWIQGLIVMRKLSVPVLDCLAACKQPVAQVPVRLAVGGLAETDDQVREALSIIRGATNVEPSVPAGRARQRGVVAIARSESGARSPFHSHRGSRTPGGCRCPDLSCEPVMGWRVPPGVDADHWLPAMAAGWGPAPMPRREGNWFAPFRDALTEKSGSSSINTNSSDDVTCPGRRAVSVPRSVSTATCQGRGLRRSAIRKRFV